MFIGWNGFRFFLGIASLVVAFYALGELTSKQGIARKRARDLLIYSCVTAALLLAKWTFAVFG